MPGHDRECQVFVAAAGQLLYGTDIGAPGIPLGIDRAELRLLVTAGLTPVQAIQAATMRAGEQLGIPRLGRLAPDSPADVIAVRGRIGARFSAFGNPTLVVAGGRVVRAPGRPQR